MKKISFVILATVFALAAVAYAHSSNEVSENNWMMDTLSVDDMEAIHEEMTKNLDPELRQEMDEMHDSCMSFVNNNEEVSNSQDNEEGMHMMDQVRDDIMDFADMMGSAFGSMMSLGGMMG